MPAKNTEMTSTNDGEIHSWKPSTPGSARREAECGAVVESIHFLRVPTPGDEYCAVCAHPIEESLPATFDDQDHIQEISTLDIPEREKSIMRAVEDDLALAETIAKRQGPSYSIPEIADLIGKERRHREGGR